MLTESKTRLIEPDITVIEISGRLNLGNLLLTMEASIRGAITEGARKMVIDVAALEYIDSAGIGMLVGCNGLMGRSGGRLRISGAQGAVAKSFGLVHMEKIAALDPDVETACRHL